jgi:hypothetical protein
MLQRYDYQGFTLQIAVEHDFRSASHPPQAPRGYLAVIRICEPGTSLSPFSPLRLGEAGGHAFASPDRTISGGFSAAQRMVDDLLR